MYRFTLICCLLCHFNFPMYDAWILDVVGKKSTSFVNSGLRGFVFLLYPFFGWIAEVVIGNLKMISLSSLVLAISATTLFVGFTPFLYKQAVFQNFRELFTDADISIGVTTSIAGLGMYEANAIQFGMDQMIEASSEQLSSFIHWYFWCVHIAPLLTYAIVAGAVIIRSGTCGTYVDYLYLFGLLGLFLSSLQMLFSYVNVFFVYFSKRCMNAQHHSRNSLITIFKVVYHSYQHKYPQQRSAFTYWEDKVPSRIDLGMQKYGGPFTYDQVEGVKTFFWLLLLIFSLFGLHLLGEGFSLTDYILNTFGCPEFVSFSSILVNPNHIPLLVILTGVPILYLGKKYLPKYTPCMLTKLRIGLFTCLATEASVVIYSLMLTSKHFYCPEIGQSVFQHKLCSFSVLNYSVNGSCTHYCSDPPVSSQLYIVYLSVIPLLLHGFSYLIVFLTALEFICAQAPNETKGLLIGMWYSTLSIRYVVTIADKQPLLIESVPWCIYHGAKGCGIVLSIVAFSAVCRYYRYRERNEVVNEQAIIEEQYERELLMNSDEDSYSSNE